METIHAIVIVFVILLIGLILFYIAMAFSELITHKSISARSLLKDFGQKMWMTIGLGIFFFGLYLLIVSLSSRMLNSEVRLNFFFYVYKHPTDFIYLGLLAFATLSTVIYICRLAIKYFYNNRSKD